MNFRLFLVPRSRRLQLLQDVGEFFSNCKKCSSNSTSERRPFGYACHSTSTCKNFFHGATLQWCGRVGLMESSVQRMLLLLRQVHML